MEQGKIQQGDKFPTERKLAEILCISRNSTREALRVMESMGVLERRQGSGNYMTGNVSDSLRRLIHMMLMINSVNKEEVSAFRRLMEKSICMSITELEEKERITLCNSLEQLLNKQTNSMDEEVERDQKFHYMLLEKTNNRFLLTLMGAVTDNYKEWIEYSLRKASEQVKQQLNFAHHAIVECIRNRDITGCCGAIDRHYDLVTKSSFVMEEKMKYKLFIFDLDGTILNTLHDLTNSTNYALEKNNFPKRTEDEIRRFVGNGIGKLIERAVPEQTDKKVTDQVLADFTEHYANHCADTTQPYDGIMELLLNLKEQKCKLACVSNKADFAVSQLCEKYFPHIFDVAVGEREGIRKKPSPDSVLEVLTLLNVSKEDAVYVGDSEVDIQTAANTEMDVISVTWGFRDKEYLISQGGKLIVDSPYEMLNQVSYGGGYE